MKKTIMAVIAAGTLYTTGWYILTDHLENQTNTFLTTLQKESDAVKFSFVSTEKFGFPFKFGVRIKGLTFKTGYAHYSLSAAEKGATYELSTNLAGKDFTLATDSPDQLTLFKGQKPLVKIMTTTDKSHYSVAFKKSPLWKTLLSEEPSSLIQDFRAFKENLSHQLSTSVETPQGSQATLEKMVTVLSHFDEINVLARNTLYSYEILDKDFFSKEFPKKGILTKMPRFESSIEIDKIELDDTKVFINWHYKDMEQNAALVAFFALTFIQDILPPQDKMPENQPEFITFMKSHFFGMQHAENKKGPETSTLKMSLATEQQDGEDRRIKLGLETFEVENNFFLQSLRGHLDSTLGHDIVMDINLTGNIDLKEGAEEFAKLAVTTQLSSLARVNPKLTKNVLSEVVHIFLDGLDSLGKIQFAVKGNAVTENVETESQKLTLKVDELSFKTSQGGFHLKGTLQEKETPPLAEFALTLFKYRTLVDSLGQKTQRLTTFYSENVEETPLKITDNLLNSFKDFLKALDTQGTENDNVVITGKLEDGGPQISGKQVVELLLLWNMILQGN